MESQMETMMERAHGAKYIYKDSGATYEYGFKQVSTNTVCFVQCLALAANSLKRRISRAAAVCSLSR